MADETYAEFSSEAIDQALEVAERYAESLRAAASGQELGLDDGTLLIGAQCVSVTVKNRQICINLPFGIGSRCLPVPSWVPNGTAAQACLDICTKWGIPCGVKVTVSVAGQTIVQKGFGCSC